MLKNKFAIYFAKQLDFLLLGMDQIVNTYNYIQFKNKIGFQNPIQPLETNFTVVAIHI